jgi:hypothetical protein
MHDQGRSVPQNTNEALRLCMKAAELGAVKAQNYLGYMYDNGRGMDPNIVRALMWYSIAAATAQPGPDKDAATRNRDQVFQRVKPEELDEVKQLTRDWLRDHGHQAS